MLHGDVELAGEHDAVDLETRVLPAAQRRDHAFGVGDHVDVAEAGLAALGFGKSARLPLTTVVVLVRADREERPGGQVVVRRGVPAS